MKNSPKVMPPVYFNKGYRYRELNNAVTKQYFSTELPSMAMHFHDGQYTEFRAHVAPKLMFF